MPVVEFIESIGYSYLYPLFLSLYLAKTQKRAVAKLRITLVKPGNVKGTLKSLPIRHDLLGLHAYAKPL